MTKHNAEFSQFRAAACREYTVPRDEEASQPKGWIQGNTKIAVTCMVNMELRSEIWSVNRDNTQSWVRIFLWIKQVCDEFEQQRHRNS